MEFLAFRWHRLSIHLMLLRQKPYVLFVDLLTYRIPNPQRPVLGRRNTSRRLVLYSTLGASWMMTLNSLFRFCTSRIQRRLNWPRVLFDVTQYIARRPNIPQKQCYRNQGLAIIRIDLCLGSLLNVLRANRERPHKGCVVLGGYWSLPIRYDSALSMSMDLLIETHWDRLHRL